MTTPQPVDQQRVAVIELLLQARTPEETHAARQAAREWLLEHPEDLAILSVQQQSVTAPKRSHQITRLTLLECRDCPYLPFYLIGVRDCRIGKPGCPMEAAVV